MAPLDTEVVPVDNTIAVGTGPTEVLQQRGGVGWGLVTLVHPHVVHPFISIVRVLT